MENLIIECLESTYRSENSSILLKCIEIEGFKSYREKVRFPIGKSLTAVIGVNGSGKSSIIEAIQFVLTFDFKIGISKKSSLLDLRFQQKTDIETNVSAIFLMEAKEDTYEINITRGIVGTTDQSSIYSISINSMKLSKIFITSCNTSRKFCRLVYSYLGIDCNTAELMTIPQNQVSRLNSLSNTKLLEYLDAFVNRDVNSDIADTNIKISKYNIEKIALQTSHNNIISELDSLQENVNLWQEFEQAKIEFINLEIHYLNVKKENENRQALLFNEELLMEEAWQDKTNAEILTTEKVCEDLKKQMHEHCSIKQQLVARNEKAIVEFERIRASLNSQKSCQNKIDKTKERLLSEIHAKMKILRSLQLEEKNMLDAQIELDWRTVDVNLNEMQLLLQKKTTDYNLWKNKISFEDVETTINGLGSINVLNNSEEHLEKQCVRAERRLKIAHSELDDKVNIQKLELDIFECSQKISNLKSEIQVAAISIDHISTQILELKNSRWEISKEDVFVSAVGSFREKIKGRIWFLWECFVTTVEYSEAVRGVLGSATSKVVVAEDRRIAQDLIQYFRDNKISVITVEILDMNAYSNQKRYPTSSMINYVNVTEPKFQSILQKYFINWTLLKETTIDTLGVSKQKYPKAVNMNGATFYSNGNITLLDQMASNQIVHYEVGTEENLQQNLIHSNCVMKQYKEQLTRSKSKSSKLASLESQLTSQLESLETTNKMLSNEENKLMTNESLQNIAISQLNKFQTLTENYNAVCSKLNTTKNDNKILRNKILKLQSLMDTNQEYITEIDDLSKKLKLCQDFKNNNKSNLQRLKQRHLLLSEQISKNEDEVSTLNLKSNSLIISTLLVELKTANCKVTKSKEKLKSMNDEELNIASDMKNSQHQLSLEITALSKSVEKTVKLKKLIKRAQVEIAECTQMIIANKSTLRILSPQNSDNVSVKTRGSNVSASVADLEEQLLDYKRRLGVLEETIDFTAIERSILLQQQQTDSLKQLTLKTHEIENMALIISQLHSLKNEAFKAWMEKVNQNLRSTYRELTGENSGGDAYFEYDTHTATLYVRPASSVQWCIFSQLSGGQQAMASFALCLAIQSTKPSPILLLDEIDSSFDTSAVSYLAQFLISRSLGNSLCQSIQTSQVIIVTHRPEFITSNIELIIGVYMHESSSKIVATRNKRFSQDTRT